MKSQSPSAIANRKRRAYLKEKKLKKMPCYVKEEDKPRLRRYVEKTLKGEIGP